MPRPASPAVYRRRRILVGSILGVLVILGLYVPAVALAPLPAAALTVSADPAPSTVATTLSTPAAGRSAISIAGTDEVLGSSGDDASVPIASVTKTITALVVLDAHPLTPGQDGPDIAITPADAQILADTIAVEGSWAPVFPGQTLSERQVLEVMLLESANNYSVTLVNWAFGSVSSYLDAADAWLTAQGLSSTAVVDSSGLDPGSRSSTSDLLHIGALVMADPVLAQIVGTATDVLPQIGEIQNTNRALGQLGVNGIKTGTTDEAGRCLLFSAPYTAPDGETRDLIGVVLGAPDEDTLYASVLALLSSAEAGFQQLDIVDQGSVVGTYTTEWGASSDVVTSEGLSASVWSQVTATRSAELDQDVTTGSAGETVGTARYTLDGGLSFGGDEELTVPLQLAGDLDGPDLWWRLTHPAALVG
ncbi:D-alanyl-D-alanine carboxypeptidase [Cnuibacter physcomitrellae]|uniref:D-alanyl-D-alanine carboxypeptidase family protein n=1 Tax=Cnuibacter physcomitrellae TaxID=1619308 RepID=UPI00217590F1|nr:D-alanyl-D-alanine carboxypeptidase [Cnuibacter physcomitrellae]MCS5496991.1 D-alanyl-D-alanine carboxypeptidase [Cnuibacter physcomitrellae]